MSTTARLPMPPGLRPAPRVMLPLAALALGTFGSGTAAYLIAGILPQIAGDLRVSASAVGLLLTVFALVYAVAAPLLTSVLGRFGGRVLITLALALFIAGNAVGAVAPGYPFLLAARVIAAAGAGLYVPTATALAARLVDPQMRGRALAIVVGGSTVANVVGVPLGVVLAARSGWRWTFVSLVLLGMLALVAVLRLLPRMDSPPSVTLSQRLGALRNTVLLIALLSTFLWTVGGFTAYTYIAPLLQHRAMLALPSIAAVLLLFGVGSILGNTIGGIASDRWGATTVCLAALLLTAAVEISLVAVAGNLPLAGAWLLGWGISSWSFFVPQQNRLIGLLPAQPSLVLSLNLSAVYFGIAGGSAAGAIFVRLGHLTAIGVAGGMIEIVAAALFVATVLIDRFGGRRSSAGVHRSPV